MHQLVFIHGGETFASYEDYLHFLKYELQYDPNKESQRRWKHTLPELLGEEWNVIAPTMPSKYNARYVEWKIWFEKVIPYLKNEVVLVGHSLGGTFLTKYLSEEKLPVSIKATLLVAAPFDVRDASYSLADFEHSGTLSLLTEQGGNIFLYHSTDDPVVPYADLAKFTAHLPEAIVRSFSDRGHFMQLDFPEIVADIKSLV